MKGTHPFTFELSAYVLRHHLREYEGVRPLHFIAARIARMVAA